jgi:murein DD-endopeptidase MepM/ murein hydrolase activator NlpD
MVPAFAELSLVSRGLLIGWLVVLLVPATVGAAGDPNVAALQGGLRARGLYDGPVDGLRGPATHAGVVGAQRRVGLVADGVVGPLTRRALRLRGFGVRTLRRGSAGSDVVALQFALAWRGFPSGQLDGSYGHRVERAVRRFQRHAGLAADGVAGPLTFRTIRGGRPPVAPQLSSWPLAATTSERYGPRGDRFHSGIDLPAAAGSAIIAAAPGRIAFAAEAAGGWGKLIAIAHRGRVRTLYAHLAQITVQVGQRVTVGTVIGRVGTTGRATGPHLHFEVRVRGAAVDPVDALP